MANRIFALLNNEELRQSFEKNALKHFHENFNIKNNIEQLENIYLKFSNYRK